MLLCVAMAFAPAIGWGYVGPGPGISLAGALLGLVGAVLGSLLMVVAWPLRKWLRKRKRDREGGRG